MLEVFTLTTDFIPSLLIMIGGLIIGVMALFAIANK